MQYVRLELAELQGERVNLERVDEHVKTVPGIAVIDAKSIYDTLTAKQQAQNMVEKRTALELLSYMVNTQRNGTLTRWVHGEANIADGLTKIGAQGTLVQSLRDMKWSIVDDPKCMSAKKRRSEGIERLASGKRETEEEAFEVLLTRFNKERWPSWNADDDEEPDWYAPFECNV
jgi:hypothetical protein